jgi:acyl phosphate:glycerol-3-phosphate acyltransferase
MLTSLLACLFGYLAGSIPSGVIVTKIAGAQDPRGIGSKNIGATNVLRTGRKDLAAITLVMDALKGTIPVLIANAFDTGASPIHLGVAAAFGAFIGHLFPLYLGFKGGKGVATFIGCLIGLAWPAALAFAVVWLAVAYLTRYSSAAALTASVISPVVLALMGRHEQAILFVILAAMLWAKHHQNIARLLAGAESKIGQKKSEPGTPEASSPTT